VHMGDPEDEGQVVIDDGSAMPLVKAPRSVRVESAAKLEELAIHLTQRMRAHAKDIVLAKQNFQRDSTHDEGSDEILPREWDDKWRMCVRINSAQVVATKYSGTVTEFARKRRWLVVASKDDLVLADNGKQQLVAVGKDELGSTLLLVPYTPPSGAQERSRALRTMRACWPTLVAEAHMDDREFVVTLTPLATGQTYVVGQDKVIHEARSLVSYEDALRQIAAECLPNSSLPF
jgi:hypothetical protein